MNAQQAQEKIAKAMSKKYDVKVIFIGDQAKTDGKTIYVPSLTESALSDETTLTKVRAFIDHEVGHVKFSSFVKSRVYGQQQFKIINLIEDFRIEKKMSDEFYGCKVNLETHANLVAGDSATENNFARLWSEARRQSCGFEMEAPDYNDECKAYFGADIFDRIKALKSTEDSIKLGTEIYKREGTKFKDQPEDQDGGQEGGGDSGEDNDSEDQEGGGGGDQDGEDQSDQDKDQKSKGQNCQEDNQDKDQKTKAKTSQPCMGGNRKDIEDFDDKSEILGKYLMAIAKAENKDGEYRPFSTEHDKIAYPFEKNSDFKHKMGVAEYAVLLENLGSLNTMRAKFTNLFKTKTMKTWSQDKESGKLNARALHTVETGNKRVFMEKHAKADNDTCVSILLDWSGSMGGIIGSHSRRGEIKPITKIDKAMEAAVMLAEVLNSLNIKSEILAFSTHYNGMINPYEFGCDCYDFGRTEALDMPLLKAFNEPLNERIKNRIGSYKRFDFNNNVDGECVQVAYDRIKVRPERRKILIVLSDGGVSAGGNMRIAKKHLKDVAKKITAERKVELFGIGFDSNCVKDYYPKHAIVMSEEAKKLPEFLFGVIKNFLIGK